MSVSASTYLCIQLLDLPETSLAVFGGPCGSQNGTKMNVKSDSRHRESLLGQNGGPSGRTKMSMGDLLNALGFKKGAGWPSRGALRIALCAVTLVFSFSRIGVSHRHVSVSVSVFCRQLLGCFREATHN